MIRQFSDFSQDEQEDFESACRASSVPLEEFDVTDVGQLHALPAMRTVTVRRNGKVMEYSAEQGSNWILQFELDLQKKIFN